MIKNLSVRNVKKRHPGLFRDEHRGKGMIAILSKCYWNGKRNEVTYEIKPQGNTKKTNEKIISINEKTKQKMVEINDCRYDIKGYFMMVCCILTHKNTWYFTLGCKSFGKIHIKML